MTSEVLVLSGFILAALLLFMLLHRGRDLRRETFEINSSNKERQKGLSFYEDEIITIMADLRYRPLEEGPTRRVWAPPLRGRLLRGDFVMEKTPYTITLEGTRGTVRIVVSMLDLKKIFL